MSSCHRLVVRMCKCVCRGLAGHVAKQPHSPVTSLYLSFRGSYFVVVVPPVETVKFCTMRKFPAMRYFALHFQVWNSRQTRLSLVLVAMHTLLPLLVKLMGSMVRMLHTTRLFQWPSDFVWHLNINVWNESVCLAHNA